MNETVASYYGQPGRDRFYGRTTASGEPLTYPGRGGVPTVAHKTLPFGTMVRFLNPASGAEITARVNDRGPYIQGREFDLSFEAAQQLGMVQLGVARLQYEVVDAAAGSTQRRGMQSMFRPAVYPQSHVSMATWTVGNAIAWLVLQIRNRAGAMSHDWTRHVEEPAEPAEHTLVPHAPLEANAFHGLPVHGRISSHFGPRWGRPHEGLDIAAPLGSPVWATAPGEVIFAGWKGGYGNTVVIRHADRQTLYGHLSVIAAHKGQDVEEGTVIGSCGSTGHSTGPHVHYGVLRNGRWVNPLGVQ